VQSLRGIVVRPPPWAHGPARRATGSGAGRPR